MDQEMDQKLCEKIKEAIAANFKAGSVYTLMVFQGYKVTIEEINGQKDTDLIMVKQTPDEGEVQ